MVKLYQAFSTVDGFDGHDGVSFEWFVYSRESPVAPYEELIADYEQLKSGQDHAEDEEPDWEDKEYAEDYIDSLLTEAEVEELRDYLARTYDMGLEAIEVAFPICYSSDPKVSVGIIPLDRTAGNIKLSEDDGYSLSVPVRAYYDLWYCLRTDQVQVGKEFLEVALALLGLSVSVEDGQLKVGIQEAQQEVFPRLQDLVIAIYNKKDLFVTSRDAELQEGVRLLKQLGQHRHEAYLARRPALAVRVICNLSRRIRTSGRRIWFRLSGQPDPSEAF